MYLTSINLHDSRPYTISTSKITHVTQNTRWSWTKVQSSHLANVEPVEYYVRLVNKITAATATRTSLNKAGLIIMESGSANQSVLNLDTAKQRPLTITKFRLPRTTRHIKDLEVVSRDSKFKYKFTL